MIRPRAASRRGAALTTAIVLTLVVATGVGIYEHYSNSRIEKAALEETRRVAEDPQYRGTRAQEQAAEDLPGEERAFRLAEGERALDIIGSAVGGRTGDVIQFINMADEAVRHYVQQLYGRDATAVELERLEARARAMQRQIREPHAPKELRENTRLILEMLNQYDEASAFLAREENREHARNQYPELRNLSDDQLLVKWLEPRLQSEVHRASEGYRQAERSLRDAGVEKPTPAMINAIVAHALRAEKSGREDFFAAIEGAVKQATALVHLDGKYSGSISGSASGSCTVDISGTSVGIELTGSGSNRHGSFSARVSGVGRVDRETGSFSGTLRGTVRNQYGSHAVSGSFSGKAGSNRVTGQWRAASEQVPASGTFSAGK